MITEKQINYIIFIINNNLIYSQTLKKFWNKQPMHDELNPKKTNNSGISNNCRDLIFRDKLKKLSSDQANYLIKLLIDNNYKKFTNLLN